METLGRGKRISWVLMFCKVVGDPPKGGGKRRLPGAEQREGHGRRFEEGTNEVWADLSQRNSMILSAFPALAVLPEV